MPVSAETLRALMAAGVVGDALLTVVEKIDADMRDAAPKEKPRSAGAERQARHRAKLKGEVMASDVTSDATNDVTSSPKEKISNPQTSLRSELKQAREKAAADFRAAFPRKPGAKWQLANEKLWRLMRDGQDPGPIIEGASRYAASKLGTEVQYICDPLVFLNGKRWLDDHEPAKPANGYRPATGPPARKTEKRVSFIEATEDLLFEPDKQPPWEHH